MSRTFSGSPTVRTVVIAGACLVAALVLAACDGAEGDVGAAATTTPVATATPASPPVDTPPGAVPLPGASPFDREPFVEIRAANGGAGAGLVDGLPPDVEGPLIVYYQLRLREFAQQVIEVGVFDAGMGVFVAGFEVEYWPGGLSIAVRDRHVYAVLGSQSLWRFALDGTEATTFWADPGADVSGILVFSDDGQRVAFAVSTAGEPGSEPSRVLVLDTVSGMVVLDMEQDPALWAGFESLASPILWRGSDAIVLHAFVGMPPERQAALLHLNGSLEPLDSAPTLDRPPRRGDGLMLSYAGTLRRCSPEPLANYPQFAAYSTIEVRHAKRGAVATIDAGGPVMRLGELSPDGEELMYERLRVSDADRAALGALVEAAACPDGALESTLLHLGTVDDAWEVRVRDLATGDERVVSHRLEVLREWHGSAALSYRCDGVELAALGMGDGIGTPPLECFRAEEVELRAGDVTVTRGPGMPGPTVLQIIEVP